MIKVSIIVPVYNAEKYLDKCIQSLVRQTLSNIEIVLVNDGSKDNSLSIIDSWKNKDSRIVVIDQENQGVTRTRKNGADIARGEWITFVDADDELPSQAIEFMLNASLGFDLVIGHVQMNLNWYFPAFMTEWTQKEYMHDLMVNRSIHWGPYAKLFRKDLISPFVFDISRKITNGEDFIFNIRYATKAKKIKIIDRDVYKYIWREGSATSKNPFKSLRYCLLYEKEVWKSFKGIRIKYLYDYSYRTLKTIYRRLRLIMVG